MTTKLTRGVAFSFVIAFAFAGSAHADITVAVAGPLTGLYRALGDQVKAGADQWAADGKASCSRPAPYAWASSGGAVWPIQTGSWRSCSIVADDNGRQGSCGTARGRARSSAIATLQETPALPSDA